MPLRLRKRPLVSNEPEKPSSSSTARTRIKVKPQKMVPVKRNKEKLKLKCQWENCRYSSSAVQTFNRHVGEHVPVIPEDEDMYIRCGWADCDHYSSDGRELRRHILYHAVHCKLTAIARNVQERSGLQPCTLAPGELHVMPEFPEPLRCEWDGCGLEWDDPQGFYWHVEHHVHCHYHGVKPADKVVVKCLWDGCAATLVNQYRLKDHMRSHTQEKMAACPVCGNVFSNNQKYFDHCKRQAPREELRYQCSHCLKTFSTERLLRDHIRSHINNYRCSVCGMTCPSPASLRQHITFRHTTEKTFKCSFCSSKFKTVFDKRKHERIHESNRRLHCPACPYSGLHPDRMKAHFKREHTEMPREMYMCHLCDAKYLKALSLTNHLKRRHHLTVPEGHVRFNYRRDKDGHFRLQTLRYESLDVAEQMLVAPSGPGAAAGPAAAEPDVLALSCGAGEVPDTITTDDGRELQLPERVRQALADGVHVLIWVNGGQVQMVAHMDAAEDLDDPDNPDALMMLVDNRPAAAAAAEAEAEAEAAAEAEVAATEAAGEGAEQEEAEEGEEGAGPSEGQ